MNRYFIYQCTVCRRTKDIPRNDTHVIPTGCTITKGCSGTLLKVGERDIAEQTAPVVGVTDWYPRGTHPSDSEPVKTIEYVNMSGSSTGALVLAIRMTEDQANAVSSVVVTLEQRRVEEISFNQFTYYVLTNGMTTISGRDSQGKNLRIDSTAVTEGRLRVRVNGVIRTDYTVNSSINSSSVVFSSVLPLQSAVDIIVFNEREVEDKELEFVTNRTIPVSDLSGAWGNVRWIDKINPAIPGPNEERWWLYTCTSIAGLQPSARIKVTQVLAETTEISFENIMFLLASPPYSHVDRYLGLVVPMTECVEDFNILTSSKITRDFMIEKTRAKSIYPPLKIKRGYTEQQKSLTSEDIIPVAKNSTAQNTPMMLTDKYTNGPI
jgi:hypothetical protein